ncbi:MAG TPA: DUF5698 domain-containing protein [Candidatus Omnitrophota bacterium]|nr:DUF5698 domain-containing protein [Candidatus Omnitrophota bacterium]
MARAADVSMSAMRIIFVSRGIRTLASVIGFFEMLIWLIGISQIMQNLDNPINYIAFAGGFSMGTFVGITIEKKIAIGNLAVQFITSKRPACLLRYFRVKGYGATVIDAQGTQGPVKIIFVIVRRKFLDNILKVIKKFDKNAFYTIEDIRGVARLHPVL